MLTFISAGGAPMAYSDHTLASSPTVQAIERALNAPSPTLRMLTPHDVYNINDVLELAATDTICVVGFSPLYRPGQPVTEYDVKWHRPRRYSV